MNEGLDFLVPVVVEGSEGLREMTSLACQRVRYGDEMLCAKIFAISGEKNRQRNKKKP